MKVIGAVPKVDGPTDVYREGFSISSTVVSPQAAALPFNFILDDVSYGLSGRAFTPTHTSVCMDIAIHAVINPGAAFGPFRVTIYKGSTAGSGVSVPRDGDARSYCWSGITAGADYHFTYGFGSGGGSGGVYEYVDGNGTVGNP